MEGAVISRIGNYRVGTGQASGSKIYGLIFLVKRHVGTNERAKVFRVIAFSIFEWAILMTVISKRGILHAVWPMTELGKV